MDFQPCLQSPQTSYEAQLISPPLLSYKSFLQSISDNITNFIVRQDGASKGSNCSDDNLRSRKKCTCGRYGEPQGVMREHGEHHQHFPKQFAGAGKQFFTKAEFDATDEHRIHLTSFKPSSGRSAPRSQTYKLRKSVREDTDARR